MSQGEKSYIGMIVPLLVTMAVASVAGWLLLGYAMPQHYFPLYPVIPIYFMVLGLVMSILIWRWRKLDGKKIVNAYMAMRGVKMALTLAGIGIYFVLEDEWQVEFALTTAVFYLIYLFVETLVLYRFEKIKKQIR
jgi:hypothetical protein